MSVPVEYFPIVLGSMSSPEGQTFRLKVKRADGEELMLGFPHHEISNIVECAAMQMDHGHDEEGHKAETAFVTTSFRVGKGPNGETVLGLKVGESGHKNVLLPPDIQSQLYETLEKQLVRH
jgi:hypothetical protein